MNREYMMHTIPGTGIEEIVLLVGVAQDSEVCMIAACLPGAPEANEDSRLAESTAPGSPNRGHVPLRWIGPVKCRSRKAHERSVAIAMTYICGLAGLCIAPQ